MEGEEKEESADTLSMLMFEKLSRPPHFIPPSIHLFVSPSSSPSHILFCVFTGAALEKEGERRAERVERAAERDERKRGTRNRMKQCYRPPPLFFPAILLFRLPTMSKNKGCKRRDTGGRMKIEEEAGSVFPST